MKRTYINLVMLLVLTGVFTMQSCKKDDAATPVAYKAAVPSTPTPGNEEVVPYTSGSLTLNLKWTGTATNAIKWDVYFDDGEATTKVASNVTTNAYDVTVTKGGTYSWKVVTVDANNVKSESPVWSVIVNSAPIAPSAYVPADATTNFSVTGTLKWTCSDAEDDDITYKVYMGSAADALKIVGEVKNTASYTPTLAKSTKYYWKVVAVDANGATTEGPVSSFTTGVPPLNFAVFSGTAAEDAPAISTAKHDVSVAINTTTHNISLFLPIADAMVAAGWGTVYSGAHGITLTYDPVALTVTCAKQLWMDSFIDPTEMGPMSLTGTGTIDPEKKTITMTWTISGNAYWGADYTASKKYTYTMK